MNIKRIELKTGVPLETLAAFYGARLGFSVTIPDAETLLVTAGESELIFCYELGFVGVYHFAFNVPENRLDAAREYLAKKGVALLSGANGETVFDFDFWDAHALYFRDPAGNIAEFIARHELRKSGTDNNAPFQGGEVSNISEIALPTADPPGVSRWLCETLGLAVYRESSADFAPVGDAHGLFIVVREGRVWFPDTGVPAQLLPVVAKVTNARGERFTVSGDDNGNAGYTVSGATG